MEYYIEISKTAKEDFNFYLYAIIDEKKGIVKKTDAYSINSSSFNSMAISSDVWKKSLNIKHIKTLQKITEKEYKQYIRKTVNLIINQK